MPLKYKPKGHECGSDDWPYCSCGFVDGLIDDTGNRIKDEYLEECTKLAMKNITKLSTEEINQIVVKNFEKHWKG